MGGQGRQPEERVAAGEGIAFTPVAVGKIRRSKNPIKMASPANVADMGRVPLGVPPGPPRDQLLRP